MPGSLPYQPRSLENPCQRIAMNPNPELFFESCQQFGCRQRLLRRPHLQLLNLLRRQLRRRTATRRVRQPCHALEGKETAFLPPPPQRTHQATFTAMGSRMAKAPLLDAGLARQRKSFANVVLLVRPIAETRAPNCNEAVSSKLPYVGPQILAHDSHTSRKSAPFRVRAKSEPLCEPLQPAVRFLRVLLPAPPPASLAVCLPSRNIPRVWR